MTKLMIMPSELDIDHYIEKADAFLFGYQGMCMNFLVTVDLGYIQAILPKLKKQNKELYIALNKNFHNPELPKVKEIMYALEQLHIDGILYYDVALLQIKEEERLKIPLIWGAEHFTTNYATMNFYQKHGVDMVYVSGEITKQEILEMRKRTQLPLIVPIFGYLPMFVSERHEVKNYLDHFQIEDDSKLYYMEKEGKRYPIIDHNEGTFVYSSYILNGYQEYLEFQKNQIDYVLLNAFLIPKEVFEQVLCYFHEQSGSDEWIDRLCNYNTNKGFLYQETVYRVKNYDEKTRIISTSR